MSREMIEDFALPSQVHNAINTLGNTNFQREAQVFVRGATILFEEQRHSPLAHFETDLRLMVKALVDSCSSDPMLDKKRLEEVGDTFVRLCGIDPKDAGTSPERARITVIEGSSRRLLETGPR